MKKREILAENKEFRLVKQTRHNKTWYEIQLATHWYHRPIDLEDELKAYFGPCHGNLNDSWRFWNRIEANKQFLYATLKWC